MFKHKFFPLFLCLFFFGRMFPIQAANPVLPSGISESDLVPKLESFIQENSSSMAGLSLTVFHKDRVLYESYHGYDNVQQNNAVTEDSIFEWGSISKLLIWVSVMQLQEQGLLNLEENAQKYLPADLLDKTSGTPITILDLMNHQAGFQDTLVGLFANDPSTPMTLEQALSKSKPAQIFEPGTVTAYSNWGASLAALIVERISEQPYENYVATNIFEPLSMSETSATYSHEEAEKIQKKWLDQAHYSASGELLSDLPMYVPLYAAGSVVGTASDLLSFSQALVPGTQNASILFDKEETLETFLTATSDYGQTGVGRNHHGLWATMFAIPVLGHGGNTLGSSSYLYLEPESGYGAVVLTNQSSETIFTQEMMKLVFGQSDRSELSGKLLPGGWYRQSRTIKEGPLAIYDAYAFPLSEGDLLGGFALDTETGRIHHLVADYLPLSTGGMVLRLVLIPLFIIGIFWGLFGLLATGVQFLRRKKAPGKETAMRKWRIMSFSLLFLGGLNLVFLALKVMNFAMSESVIWHFIVFGILAGLMTILLARYVYLLRSSNNREKKFTNVFTAVLLIGAVVNIVWWQLYQFWAI